MSPSGLLVARRRAYSPGGSLLPPVLTGQATAWSAGDGTVNGDTVSVTIPGTALVGDTILLFVVNMNNVLAAPAPPAGYVTRISAAHTSNGRGIALSVFSKTATLGDIGSTVTMAHIDNRIDSATAGIHVRTYTCGGVDSSTSGTGTAASLAASFITSTVKNEAQVSYFACVSSTGSITSVSLSAGSTDTMTSLKPGSTGGFTPGFGGIAAEDWQLPAAGTTGTGGTFTPNGANAPANVCASVMLLP